MEVYDKVIKLQYTFPPNFTSPLRDFIRSLLQIDPNKRLGNQRNGAADIMADKWFANFDWEALEGGTFLPPHVPKVDAGTHTAHKAGPMRQKVIGEVSLDEVDNDIGTKKRWNEW